MLCDNCDEYHFPRKPTSSSAAPKSAAVTVGNPMASTKLANSEVLYFMQNKSSVLPLDSAVTIRSKSKKLEVCYMNCCQHRLKDCHGILVVLMISNIAS